MERVTVPKSVRIAVLLIGSITVLAVLCVVIERWLA